MLIIGRVVEVDELVERLVDSSQVQVVLLVHLQCEFIVLLVIDFTALGSTLTQGVQAFLLIALKANNFVRNDLVFLQGERLNLCAREA